MELPQRPFADFTIADALAKTMLSPKRYIHSANCAHLAGDVARQYGLDPEALRFAGMVHDLCKELPCDEQATLAARCPFPLHAEALENPRFLHGPAAAVYLATSGLCSTENLLKAIAWHTVGAPAMDNTALVMYLSDKLECGRGDWAVGLRNDWLGGCFPGERGLLTLTCRVVELLQAYFLETEQRIAASLPALYNALQQRLDPAVLTAATCANKEY